MDAPTLDDFMAFNEQLAALAEAGVPIDVGDRAAEADLLRSLERINISVARRMSRGEPLQAAIQDESVPEWYRYMVLTGLCGHNTGPALDAMSRVANSVDETRYVIGSALFYPLVVCTLAYAGLVSFCLFFVPSMAVTFREFFLEPKGILKVLVLLTNNLAYWVAIPPVLLVLYIVWRFRGSSIPAAAGRTQNPILRKVSGLSRAMFEQRSACFADSLASLEEDNVPLDEALPVAGAASGDANLEAGANAMALQLSRQEPAPANSGVNNVPPFLRWAVLQSAATVGRDRALRMAAAVYRHTAARRFERARVAAPLIALVVIGGGVTLMYCLALFVPVIHLLEALSK